MKNMGRRLIPIRHLVDPVALVLAAAVLLFGAPSQAAAQDPPSEPPGPPASVSLVAGTEQGTLQLSWSAPTVTNGAITGYRWEINDSVSGVTVALSTTASGVTSATASNLYDGSYTGSVWAGNATGEGVAATTAALAYSDGLPPPTPTPQPTGSPPQQIHWRDRFCYGFPGCPDSYLFLVPTLVGLFVGAGQRMQGQKVGGKRQGGKNKQVESTWLAASVLAAFIGTAVVMQINPLKVVIYLLVPLAVGVTWWVWRRG